MNHEPYPQISNRTHLFRIVLWFAVALILMILAAVID
jgi:hypothetical protein